MDTYCILGTWCTFYATKCEVYWGLALDVFLLAFWFDITHTNIHTAHSGATMFKGGGSTMFKEEKEKKHFGPER